MNDSQCVYCHPTGERVVWQDQYCRVLLAQEAGFPGWCRVVWQQHRSELSELSEDERQHLLAVVSEVEAEIRRLLKPHKVNLASLGTALPHLHWHVIPRYAEDSHFPEPVWGAPLRQVEVHPLPAGFVPALAQRLNRRFGRPQSGEHQLFVIMGVSGSGKSVVAQRLSQRLGIPCLDGDFLHPRANVDKMAGGQALDDDDRAPWLQALNEAAYAMLRTNANSLLVCSALKKRYRDRLRRGNPRLSFLFLDGKYALIEARLRQRKGHFFRSQMLDSQFAALELPDATEQDVVTIDIDRPLEQVVAACAQAIVEKHAAATETVIALC